MENIKSLLNDLGEMIEHADSFGADHQDIKDILNVFNKLKFEIQSNFPKSDISSLLTLFGVFSPDKQLKSVHISEDGAKQNQEKYGKDYYVAEFFIGR